MGPTIIATLTLVVAAIGAALTLLFGLHHERVAKRNELLKWVERALSLIGTWKLRGQTAATEYELDRVVGEADSASALAGKLGSSSLAKDIRAAAKGLTELRTRAGWDAQLGDPLAQGLDATKHALVTLNTWWPLP